MNDQNTIANVHDTPAFADGPAPQPAAPEAGVTYEPQRGDTIAYGPAKADYFDVYTSLTAGDKLRLLRALGVPESSLVVTGTAQLVAVVWKFLKGTSDERQVTDLLDCTDEQLLAHLNLTDAEYAAQVRAWMKDGQSKS